MVALSEKSGDQQSPSHSSSGKPAVSKDVLPIPPVNVEMGVEQLLKYQSGPTWWTD